MVQLFSLPTPSTFLVHLTFLTFPKAVTYFLGETESLDG